MPYVPLAPTPVTVTVNDGPLSDITKTHPSFGMLRFSRITTSENTRLFGSELKSGSFIRMSLSPGEEIWHLHEKRFHAHSHTLVEVDLTAAQFAELITTMNHGSGIPCTIRHVNGAAIPDFIDNDTYSNQIKKDIHTSVSGILNLTKKLKKEAEEIIGETGLSKTKRDRLNALIEKLDQEISSNMPFVLEQYVEGVDKVTMSAKAELDSFVTHLTTQLGVKSLAEAAKHADLNLPS